jgi:beta-lactamase regulating signal transducer with metallopeptidase domain
MNFYNYYIGLIIILKTIFFILSLIEIYFRFKNKQNISNNSSNNSSNNNNKTDNTNNQKIEKYVTYLRSRCEFVVTILMSLLMVYIFNPLRPRLNMIGRETKLLFFIFGIILLLTANWSDFIGPNKNLEMIKDVLS